MQRRLLESIQDGDLTVEELRDKLKGAVDKQHEDTAMQHADLLGQSLDDVVSGMTFFCFLR